MRDYQIRLKLANSRHLYDVGVKDKAGDVYIIEVEANNRSQASRIAEKAGYEVRDVNLVG